MTTLAESAQGRGEEVETAPLQKADGNTPGQGSRERLRQVSLAEMQTKYPTESRGSFKSVHRLLTTWAAGLLRVPPPAPARLPWGTDAVHQLLRALLLLPSRSLAAQTILGPALEAVR